MKSEHEDLLTELPPLDGDVDEPESDEGTGDDLPADADDDNSLDDRESDQLEMEEAVEIADEESVNEDDDTWEADVGEAELDVQEASDTESSEADPTAFGDVEIDDDLEGSDEDGGVEGTTDPIEQALDEELPPLDADEDGDFEDEWMGDTAQGSVPSSPSLGAARWADVAWEERSSRQISFAWAPEGGFTSIAVAPLLGCVLFARGSLDQENDLWLSRDGGVTAARLHLDAPWLAPSAFGHLLAVSGTRAEPKLWVISRAGEVAESVDWGVTWTRAPAIGRSILALSVHEDGALSVLAQKGPLVGERALRLPPETELLTSTDGVRWFADRLHSLRAPVGPASHRVWLTNRGAATAMADREAVWCSRDGRTFSRIAGAERAQAGVFAGPGPDAPLLFVGEIGDDRETCLVRVQDGGAPEILAELPIDDSELPVLGLSWDEGSRALFVWFADHVAVWTAASS